MDPDLRHLTRAGWILAVVSIAVIALVSIPVGAWALENIDRSTLRHWTKWIVVLLSLNGLAAGVLTFVVGERALRRWGVAVRRSAEPDDAGESGPRDAWILWAVVLGLNALIWGAFFLFADV